MKVVQITVPDQVEELLRVMAEASGQSISSLGCQLLATGAYEEASRRFKGINYLRAVRTHNTLTALAKEGGE